MTAPISVVPYDREWPRLFDAERITLEEMLESWLDGGVHHIGSTAVPGLAAKPLVDMIAGVRDFEDAQAAYEPLLDTGWEHTPQPPRHRPPLLEAGVGLHLTEPGSDLWVERLTFRDALRGDPDLAAEYQALKLALAHRYPEDVSAYTAGKRDFVVGVLAPAGVELGRR